VARVVEIDERGLILVIALVFCSGLCGELGAHRDENRIVLNCRCDSGSHRGGSRGARCSRRGFCLCGRRHGRCCRWRSRIGERWRRDQQRSRQPKKKIHEILHRRLSIGNSHVPGALSADALRHSANLSPPYLPKKSWPRKGGARIGSVKCDFGHGSALRG
jgi:hypothetical protein